VTEFPALDPKFLAKVDRDRLEITAPSTHPPRILLLYGSLRERSFSRLLVEEAARILQALGCETRIFDPRDLPLPDAVGPDHPKVQELRALSQWSEGQVCVAPSGMAPSRGS
jgi:arsenical resistance protein ArsH